jgi:xylulose-5-phosphate/fructose-6-phosphate phosphoketolase
LLHTDSTPAVRHSRHDLELLNAYWRAANYLSVGQIYLLDDRILREPLLAEHVKPRLLGHWGTAPGLNLVYAHMNRAINQRDLNALYVTGPGHGGPGLVANAYLEGTYSEMYASVPQDENGMRALFRQFSCPGRIPSHVAPETPGSIHEGGDRQRRAAGTAPQRLQDREPDRAGPDPHRRADLAAAGLRLRTTLRRR